MKLACHAMMANDMCSIWEACMNACSRNTDMEGGRIREDLTDIL